MLGMVLFSSYAVFMIFIVLTMMLKIVDVAYENMRAVIFDTSGKRENFPIQIKLAMKKIVFDFYWNFKVQATLKSARMTELAIANMRKTGKGLDSIKPVKGLFGMGASTAALIDESVADLIHVETEVSE